MTTFEVLLTDGTVECIQGADTYGQEGPLTTFYRTDEDRRVIDCWSECLESIRTADIVPATRCAEPTYWAGTATEACEDHLNNVEQIVVDAPEPGAWRIQVRGRVLEDDQSYSLVVTQACGTD